MPISLKRAYDAPSPDDGYRVLVDKLWPMALPNKTQGWTSRPRTRFRNNFPKEAFPGNPYLSEFQKYREKLRELPGRATKQQATLVFGSKDLDHNNAMVVEEYLGMFGRFEETPLPRAT